MPFKYNRVWHIGDYTYYVSGSIPDSLISRQHKAERILVLPNNMKVKNLITAHPRSGTRWISRLLQNNGLDMPHENFGEDGIVSWQGCVPDQYRIKAKNTVHLVRDPLKTMTSFAHSMGSHALPYMMRYIGVPPTRNKLVEAMYAWYNWNKLIESIADARLRLEDVTEDPRIIFDYFKHRVDGEIDLSTDKFSQNKGVNPKLTWKDFKKANKIWYLKVLELAKKYGY